DYKKARSLGFEYFQGIYLSQPTIVKDAKTISFLKSTIIKAYDAIKSEDIKQVIEIIEKDVGMTYKLLKLLNSIYSSKTKEFKNIEDAILYLGLENVVKFLIVLALSDMFVDEEDKNLWKRALFRANLGEKLAKIYASEISEKAYLAGLFSLSWDILGQRPEDLARSLSLDEDIVEAYENRLSPVGFILSNVELLEDKRDEETMKKIAKVLEIPIEKLKEILEESEREVERFIV
ncbi:MAG: HDOD domain-containing protein, partial [Aquificaceae bacterium]